MGQLSWLGLERNPEQLNFNGAAALAMDGTRLTDLELQTLIAPVYGSRARLLDVQRMSDGELANRQQHLADANRLVSRIEQSLLSRASSDPVQGWAIFDLIKSSHDGGIQRLSQQIRDQLPDRSAFN
ncbi:hypothetical protein [Herbiconiux sp. UC225_62]|uniref:hypothetical protein n=1 Tax=Herbiconiux sp. UC225_62 TaxID=3350168 RepID=UPI0036D2166D